VIFSPARRMLSRGRAWSMAISESIFFQFELVEAGVFRLIHQFVVWLQRAAWTALR
jgi:hypothetical protein